MTDIRHHLKGICKILKQYLATPQPDLFELITALRAYLPSSYGIASGRLVSYGRLSQPIPIILYDIHLAGGLYPKDATAFPLETALLILDFAPSYRLDEFRQVLERIKSVKELPNARRTHIERPAQKPLGQNRLHIPKDRLPFALVYCQTIEDVEETEVFSYLYKLMPSVRHQFFPDQIEIAGAQLQFLNPSLTAFPSNRFDIGWRRSIKANKPFHCYICKEKYLQQHPFYEQLCLSCGDLNYHKRVQTVDLTGYRFLITGARVKIGYAVALRLLRSGAEVIVTSRFPHDTARRYRQEADFEQWASRLRIYGLDLRQVGLLENFVAHLEQTYPYLDGIINNAAQTVKRPPAFYAHLLEGELQVMLSLPVAERDLIVQTHETPTYLQATFAGQLGSGTVDDPNFPQGEFDEHGQQVDNRDYNSWVMRLEEIPPVEIAEVHLVNAIAPAILTGQLKKLLEKSPHRKRFVINVSAAEGRFSQHKNGYHPHTNMAKAALNMLTRSIADHYAGAGILVSSVDPGWVSDQVPRTGDESRHIAAIKIPIDMLDAAARVCDPIFSAMSMAGLYTGVLLKDYQVVDW